MNPRAGRTIEQALAESNRLGIQLCTIELDLAAAILDRADSTRDPESRDESISRATIARDTVVHFLPRLRLATDEEEALRRGLAALTARLGSAGF